MSYDWYVHGDEREAALEKLLVREFQKSRLTLNFDELNVRSASAEATRLYNKLASLTRSYMLDVAKTAYRDVMDDLKAKRRKPINLEWLLAFLLLYDPVTKYVYAHEVERKRARFFEALVSDLHAGNRRAVIEDYRTAMNAWVRQTRQYMVNVEDAAINKAFRDAGVERVKWITEKDDRVCGTCAPRNDVIYSMKDVPDKPHYGCRCTLEPIVEGNTNEDSARR